MANKGKVSVSLSRTLKTADYESIKADFGMETEIDSTASEALTKETKRLFGLIAEQLTAFQKAVKR